MIDINSFHTESISNLHLTGVYKITCKHNSSLIYVGSTGKVSKYQNWSGFKLRWLHHLSSLIIGKHANIRIQRIVNKYGVEDLVFSILEITDPNEAIIREQYWIYTLDSYKNGLNLRPIAKSNLGLKQCPESVKRRTQKASKTLKERWSKEAHYRLGYIMSDEHKQRLSISKRKLDENTILEIHTELKEGKLFPYIRDKYDISQDTLRRVINGKFNSLDWSFITKRSQKFNEDKLNLLYKLYMEDKTHLEISKILNVSQQAVSYRLKELVKSKL